MKNKNIIGIIQTSQKCAVLEFVFIAIIRLTIACLQCIIKEGLITRMLLRGNDFIDDIRSNLKFSSNTSSFSG
ncbi:MAG: hypothetical protein PHP65_05785 [Bacilli bacterium]|nr:hypothetical protein [Bacilli bacterium]